MTAGPVAGPRPVTPSTILAATLHDVRGRLERIAGRQQVDDLDALLADVTAACALAAGLDPYLDRCTTAESPALRLLAEQTSAHDWSGSGSLEQEMLSGHVEGRLLGFLVRATRARRVLEIGMFTGYSALAMAEALPVDGELIACELDADVAAFARARFASSPAGRKITVRVAPALETLRDLAAAGEVFDLVFVDADKAGYVDYLTAVLDTGLLAPDGLLAVDNTLMQGEPWVAAAPSVNGRAIARFNEAVVAEARVEQVLLPLRDGLTLIRWAEGAA